MALTVEQLQRIKHILTEDVRGIKGIDKAMADNAIDDRESMMLAKSELVKSSNENADLVEAVDDAIAEIKNDWRTRVKAILPDDIDDLDEGPATMTIYKEDEGLALNIVEHGPGDFGLIAERHDLEVESNELDPNDASSCTAGTVLKYVKQFFPEK